MAYTSTSRYITGSLPPYRVTVKGTDAYGVPFATRYSNITSFAASSMSRSGTNSSVKLPLSNRTSTRVPKVVYYYSKDKRVRVLVKTKSGRSIWTRRRLKVPKIVWVRKKVKSRPVKTGLDLPPNQLSFTKLETDTDPAKVLSWKGYSLNGLQSYEISGALQGSFDARPYGSVAKKVGYPGIEYWCNTNFLTCTPALVSEVSNRALSALYERCKNQKFNAAQALGERRQTIQLLCDTVTRVASAVKDAKRGNVRNALAKLLPTDTKQLANDWLVYQYGVKPLLSDVKGLAEVVASAHVDPIREYLDIIVTRSSDSQKWTSSITFNHWVHCIQKVEVTGKVTVKYKLRFKLTSPGLNNLASLGFTNPAALAWELMPWSFVIDWFLPIGDQLQALDAFTGLTYVSGHKTVVREENVSFSRVYGSQRSANGIAGPKLELPCNIKKFNVERTVLSAPPAFPSLSFKDPVSDTHIANAVALLRQLKK